ncbi:isochorismatase family protein [Candidatus Saccharibacteria bacterium]|nr:isochorismatase family protein [Candidatus Saccharibacteria bacterium]
MKHTLNNPRNYGDVITIVVDEQNDFCPGGSLAVTDGDRIVPPTNAITDWTRKNGGSVVFTRDKHNPETAHFISNGGPWPPHCVRYDDMEVRPQGTEGAALRTDLDIREGDAIASKGMSNLDDGYSGMEAQLEPRASILNDIVHDLAVDDATVEAALLRTVRVNQELGARTLTIVMGLATDYCVRATVLDALRVTDRKWVDVVAVEDAMRAVDLAYGDGEKAIAEMKAQGAVFMQTYDVIEGGIIVDRRGER